MKKSKTLIVLALSLVAVAALLIIIEKPPVDRQGQGAVETAFEWPELGDDGYRWIAAGIFRNETGGRYEKLTYWGEGEQFPSLGIGHFIWFPAGVDAPFDEQFPNMVEYVASAADDDPPMPAWLRELDPFDAPWSSKQQFDADQSSAELTGLRQWLADTRQYQARFIVAAFRQRWQDLELPAKQRQQFNRILGQLVKTPEGLFAVIDYYNFKGLGNNPRESYQGEGWGLLQVLQAMQDAADAKGGCEDPLGDFVNAAAERLRLRVELSPPERNESRWLAGWLRRLEAYTGKTSLASRVGECGFRVTPYLQNPAADAITISWLSNSDRPGRLEVRSANDPGADEGIVLESNPELAASLAYHPAEKCQDSYCAAAELPYLHEVRVNGLQPGGEYLYEVTQEFDKGQGRFTLPGPDTTSFRFIFFADSETEPESTGKHTLWPAAGMAGGLRRYPVDQTTGYAQNLAVIQSRRPDLVVYAGDLVQSGGEQRDWDEFWLRTGDLAADTVIVPALGNHDYFGGPGDLGKYETEDSERSVRKYLTYFDVPENDSANRTHAERYYALRYGPVSIIVLDPTDGLPHRSERDPNWRLRGEHDGGNAPDWHPGSEQFAWLEKHLQAARENSAFTFVVFHAAPYTSGVHGLPPGEGGGYDILSSVPLRELTPVFLQYGVDAVFSGHDEMYEHSLVAGVEVLADGREISHQIHFLDVGIAGDGLRGPVENVPNPYRVFLADTDSQEIYDGDGKLLDGGKHYGHVEVNVTKTADGQWRAQFDPVYVFPLPDAGQQPRAFERRLYDDSFTLITGDLE
jgi:3',5'-cyclic AMP phosphodiesterase CpdA